MKVYRTDGLLIGEFESVKAAIKARANLAWANLAGANLARANLTGAYLAGANLAGADLAGANLAEANLAGADLAGADLAGAYLAGANLAWANLAGANLAGADLAGADLAGANLARANLTGAYLAGANLARANLAGAYLAGAALPCFSILPDGKIIGWKKLVKGVICKLEISAEAKRVNSTSRKCRAEFAKVLWLSEGTESCGIYDPYLIYRVGEIVRPDSFDPDFRLECSHGIHFFITRQEAEVYD